MTDYKHLNTHPDFVPLKELARWGEQHPDLWVQKLAEVVSLITNLVSSTRDIELFFDEYEGEIRTLKRELNESEENEIAATNQAERLVVELNAIKFKLNDNEQAFVIDSLKSRIVQKQESTDALVSELKAVHIKLVELQQNYNDLEEKYNTWVKIAT